MKLYSNEIVFAGHPDKICDQISGAILDAYLKLDKDARCGIEVCGGKGKIFITGEVTSVANVDITSIVERILKRYLYNAESYEIIDNIGKQSPDIALGVDTGGAGDNGMMFGYACNDTPALLPTAMVILQRFAKKYDLMVHPMSDFLPDGKAQITGIYDKDFKLQRIKTFTICYQNKEKNRTITDALVQAMANGICSEFGIEVDEFLINPTGKFLVGGFDGDAGLTGRKIVVDAYQSFANVGGGCMNGKDPSKVDISGAYKARELACFLVREKGYKWCEIQLSYAIGVERPVGIYISTDQGEVEPGEYMFYSCTPRNIIDDLGMKKLIYEDQAKFGHFHIAW